MDDLVTITVDGREIRAAKGALLWEVCQAHGIDIPIFCYHTKLGPVGACRTCLVEQEGMTKGPITACSTPVTDGMVIRTRSAVVEKAQRGIFEFLLANHPLDCPICDRGGECPLQDQAFAYGPGSSRYIEPKRHHVKPVVLGPTIALDRERCVLCWRCVRFCSEVAEDNSIVLLDRGDHTYVGTFHDEPYVSNFSGNVVELCPVGALLSRKQRFNFRPWELRNRPSVCPHCAMGCNINVSVRKNDEVIRFLSRDNPAVDDGWLCDRGRYDFEFINSPDRIASPLIRRGEAFVQSSWTEALSFIAERLKPIIEEQGPETVAGIASPRLSNEDLWVFRRFFRDVVGSSAMDHYPRPQAALTPGQQSALSALDRRLGAFSDIDTAKTVLLFMANPSEREPVMELRIRLAVNRHQVKLIIVEPEEMTLSGKAHEVVECSRERQADWARAMCSVIRGTDEHVPGIDVERMKTIAANYFAHGSVVVLYDDAFEGVHDKGDALQAVSDLVEALSEHVGVRVLPMFDECNSMGARDLNILPDNPMGGSWGRPVLDEMLTPDSQIRVAFCLGANPAHSGADPDVRLRLKDLELLVVSEMFMTETARLADVILPAASFAEKVGTVTNSERRVQSWTLAVPSPGMARADWEMLVDLSQYFDAPLDYGLPRDIWEDIRGEVAAYADMSYESFGLQGARPSTLQAV